MAEKRKQSARDRARQARSELAARKREQQQTVETHQVAFFAAQDDIDAFDAKIKQLREQIAKLEAERDASTAEARAVQQHAIGALVEEAKQAVEDVAVLLGVTQAEVKKARTAYRKTTSASSDAPDTRSDATNTDTADDGVSVHDAA